MPLRCCIFLKNRLVIIVGLLSKIVKKYFFTTMRPFSDIKRNSKHAKLQDTPSLVFGRF